MGQKELDTPLSRLSLTHSHRKKDQDKEDGEWGDWREMWGDAYTVGSREYHQLRK